MSICRLNALLGFLNHLAALPPHRSLELTPLCYAEFEVV